MQGLHRLFGKQLSLSRTVVRQPTTIQWKNNYLARNWFSTQKDLMEEQKKKEEPVFDVDVNSLTYKLHKVKQEKGPVDFEDDSTPITTQERLDAEATVNYIAKKLPWHNTPPRQRKDHHFFKPEEINANSVMETDIEPLPKVQEKCYFCSEIKKGPHPRLWDSMNLPFWRKFLTPHGLIKSRFQTGTCSKHQRKVAHTVKRMIHMGLINFKTGLGYDSPYTPSDYTIYVYDEPMDPNEPEQDTEEDPDDVQDEEDAQEFYADSLPEDPFEPGYESSNETEEFEDDAIQKEIDYIEKELGSIPVIRKILDREVDEDELDNLEYMKLPDNLTKKEIESLFEPKLKRGASKKPKKPTSDK